MKPTRAELRSWIPRLHGRRLLVLGDLILDRYLLTTPLRLSREAPVMIAGYESEVVIPGGAANAVVNLLALGAEVSAVGVVGTDADGEALSGELAERGVDVRTLVRAPSQHTVVKTRVMVGEANRMKQQVLRIDRDAGAAPTDQVRAQIDRMAEQAMTSADAILISDYGYETVNALSATKVARLAGQRPVSVDSRYLIGAFQGVSLLTPNEAEAEEAVGFRFRSQEDLERGGRALLDRSGARVLLVTRGNQGMSLFVPGRQRVDIAAAGTDQVVDVSGAGDTVIAVATLALSSGAEPEVAARLANLAAGVVVAKWGAATCSPEELERAVEAHG